MLEGGGTPLSVYSFAQTFLQIQDLLFFVFDTIPPGLFLEYRL